MKLAMPDITLAQILAALTFIAGQAVTMGLADEQTTKTVLSIAITIATAAWAIGDAIIRNGRSRALLSPGTPIVKDETTTVVGTKKHNV
jgi:hypothetical protein